MRAGPRRVKSTLSPPCNCLAPSLLPCLAPVPLPPPPCLTTFPLALRFFHLGPRKSLCPQPRTNNAKKTTSAAPAVTSPQRARVAGSSCSLRRLRAEHHARLVTAQSRALPRQQARQAAAQAQPHFQKDRCRNGLGARSEQARGFRHARPAGPAAGGGQGLGESTLCPGRWGGAPVQLTAAAPVMAACRAQLLSPRAPPAVAAAAWA